MITNQWIIGDENLSLVYFVRQCVYGEQRREANDAYSMHLVLFEEEKPVAAGKIFYDAEKKGFCLGTIGVIEAFRKQYIGDLLVRLLLYRAEQFANVIYVTCEKALAPFFKRYGFGETSQDETLVTLLVKKDEIRWEGSCKEKKSEREV